MEAWSLHGSQEAESDRRRLGPDVPFKGTPPRIYHLSSGPTHPSSAEDQASAHGLWGHASSGLWHHLRPVGPVLIVTYPAHSVSPNIQELK